MNKNQLTRSGLENLEKELKQLKEVERPLVIKALQEARAQGDLSENADYDAARDKQAEIEARIRDIEAILSNYTIIDDSDYNKNSVSLGKTVVIRRVDTGKESKFEIVGTVEADPFNNKISNECALAKGILNKKVGDICHVKAPQPYDVEIVEIIK